MQGISLAVLAASALLSAAWLWSAKTLYARGRYRGLALHCYAVGTLPVLLLSLVITFVFLVKVAPGLFTWLDSEADTPALVRVEAIFVAPFILPVPLAVFWAWQQILSALERWLGDGAEP